MSTPQSAEFLEQIADVPPDQMLPSISEVEETLSKLATQPQPPAFLRTRNVRAQFLHAFELIGGIPRLAFWAHQNPDKFYQLYSKLIPAQVTGANGGALRLELSWVNGRDTTGRSLPAEIVINPQTGSPE